MRHSFKHGLGWATVIAAALVFLPSLVATRLDAWRAAENLLPKHPAFNAICGPEATVNLSRWFYTYRFSGERKFARFSGSAAAPGCARDIVVELKSDGGSWTVENVSSD